MDYFFKNSWSNEDDPFPKDWKNLIKQFEELGELRGNDGEWEDVWNESGES